MDKNFSKKYFLDKIYSFKSVWCTHIDKNHHIYSSYLILWPEWVHFENYKIILSMAWISIETQNIWIFLFQLFCIVYKILQHLFLGLNIDHYLKKVLNCNMYWCKACYIYIILTKTNCNGYKLITNIKKVEISEWFSSTIISDFSSF